MVYTPILKGRDGELKAIKYMPASLTSRILPIFEVLPLSGDPLKDANAFSEKARDSVPWGMTVAIEADHLGEPTEGWRGPLQNIAEDFACRSIPIRPVLHLHDSDRRLAEAKEAMELHTGQAVIRLGGELTDPDDNEAETKLIELCRRAGTTIEQSALILDFFGVGSARDLSRVEPQARKCVAWARRYPWESITVAAGAMPKDLTKLPKNTATQIPRHDLALWRRLQEPDVGFGDYGIGHPEMTLNGRAPLPNLRYTDDDAWWIYRWTREGAGNEAMYDLCYSLVAALHWPDEGADYSWGDREIAHRAERIGGTGNPLLWRAWGTSHHLTHVVRTLDAQNGAFGG